MIFRILPILLLTIILPSWYVYKRFVKPSKMKRPLKMSLCAIPIIVCILSLLLGFHETHTTIHALFVELFMYVYLWVFIPLTFFTIISVIGWTFNRTHKSLSRFFDWTACTIGSIVFLSIVYGSIWGYRLYKIKEVTFTLDNLPAAFDGYRIVQFSDLHIGTFRYFPGNVTKIVNLVNNQQANLIVFTGDAVNYTSKELMPFLPQLKKLKATDGVYSIMGNHDYCMYLKNITLKQRHDDIIRLQNMERSIGWQLLLNEHRIIHRNNDSIIVIGSENDGRPPFPARGNLKKSLMGLDKEQNSNSSSADKTVKILLTHDPTQWRQKVVAKTNIDLTLSGHTHGMQLEIFGWSPAKYLYKEWKGCYADGQQYLYVNLGVGDVMMPFRFGAWPEISVIVLRSSKKNK